MAQYKCLSCGYSGDKLVYQFTDYSYCIASNEEEPEFIDCCPSWAEGKGLGDAEIGEPVGCPECHAWGIGKFKELE